MAKLFLSYSRKDASRARRFSDWLEGEGHDVWRDDDDIGGGASFSSEIEKALEACDAVLVLWSVDSVASAWVRDEAGFGRDAGKLIPISLDSTGPPLGFRQFQSIELSKWKHGEPAVADRVRTAIARIAGSQSLPVSPTSGRRKPRLALPRPVFTVALLIAAAVAVAGFVAWRSWAKSQGIIIAVLASPTSPDHATATDYANQTAADMAAFLPIHFDRATVIAPSDATNRTSGNRMLISANPHGRAADASITLSDRDGHTILWSKSWNVPDASAIDLREHISRSASQAALCLTEAEGGRNHLTQPALGQFMSGCVGIGESEESDAELLATFERVVKLAPDFPRGWAYLAIGRAIVAAGKSPSDPAMKGAREAIATARKLNSRSGLACLAESLLFPNDRVRVLALVNRGAELEPDSALLQTQLAEALRSFGRMGDSVQAAKRAVELDPLSSYVRSNYISALTYAGQLSRAQADIAEALKKWPNDPDIDSADFGFQYRYGDPRAAQKLMPSVLNDSDARLEPYRKIVAARLDPTPDRIDDAIRTWDEQASRGDHRNQYLLALGLFGRVDQAYGLLNDPQFQPFIDPGILFRPEFAAVRADRRFMRVAARLRLARYWRESGQWPDFCANERLTYDCKTEAAKYR